MIAMSSTSEMIKHLGWVLVHSLWQLTAIAMIAWLVDWTLHRASPNIRYAALMLSLGAMCIAPIVTWNIIPVTVPGVAFEFVSAESPPVIEHQTRPFAKPDVLSKEAQSLARTTTLPDSTPPTQTSPVDAPPLARWMLWSTSQVRPWLNWIVLGWSLGISLFTVRLFCSWTRVWQLRVRGTSPLPEALNQSIQEGCRRLGIHRAVSGLQSTLLSMPIALGIIRPVVLLPASAVTGLSSSQIESIILHELAHIRRQDYVMNLFQTVLETIFYFHPAVWWLTYRIRCEREHCCDDLAIEATGNRVEYARTLLAVEEQRDLVSPLVLAYGGGSLLARVRRILAPVQSPTILKGRLLTCLTITVLFASGFAFTTQSDETIHSGDQPAAGNEVPPTPELPISIAQGKQVEPIESNRVVDVAGKPIPGARIEFTRGIKYDWQEPRKPIAVAVADATGKFTYPDKLPDVDRFYVYVEADGFLRRYWQANRQIYVKENGVRQPDLLTLLRPVTINGTIIGTDGKPLADADIAVDYFFDGGVAHINGNRVKSDANGKFTAIGVPPANVFVRYESGERKPKGVQAGKLCITHIKPTDGQQIDDLILDLRLSDCVIDGIIVDHEEKGVEGRWIEATIASAKGRLDESIKVETDANGRFRFEGLTADEFVVGTYTPGFNQKIRLTRNQPAKVRLTTYVNGSELTRDQTAPAWGKPNKKAIVGGLRMVPAHDHYSIGDTATVQVVIRNTSKQVQMVPYSFAPNANLHAQNDAGESITEINYGSFTGIPYTRYFRLQPNHVAVLGQFKIGFVDPNDKNNSPPASTFKLPCSNGQTINLFCDLDADVFGQSKDDQQEGEFVTGRIQVSIKKPD